MEILGLHHITIVCSDAERTCDYYTRVLGMTLVKRDRRSVRSQAPSSCTSGILEVLLGV